MNTINNGKGDRPRNNSSEKFRENYDEIFRTVANDEVSPLENVDLILNQEEGICHE